MHAYQHQIHYHLENGLEITLRMLLSADKSKIKEGFQLLSPESRYTRFFSYMQTLSDAQLEYLSNVDQVNHVAWGVSDPMIDPERGIGVGRFIRVETCPNCAEMAFTVLDEYQGKGIGTALLGLLYVLAQSYEIEFFTGSILSQNKHFWKRLRDIGAESTDSRGGIIDFKLPIYQHEADLPQNEFTPRWSKMIMTMKHSLFTSETN